MTDTDDPRATETEQEQGPQRIAEEEDMRGYGEPDPDLPGGSPPEEEDA
jgi:hypothetical protein